MAKCLLHKHEDLGSHAQHPGESYMEWGVCNPHTGLDIEGSLAE